MFLGISYVHQFAVLVFYYFFNFDVARQAKLPTRQFLSAG